MLTAAIWGIRRQITFVAGGAAVFLSLSCVELSALDSGYGTSSWGRTMFNSAYGWPFFYSVGERVVFSDGSVHFKESNFNVGALTLDGLVCTVLVLSSALASWRITGWMGTLRITIRDLMAMTFVAGAIIALWRLDVIYQIRATKQIHIYFSGVEETRFHNWHIWLPVWGSVAAAAWWFTIVLTDILPKLKTLGAAKGRGTKKELKGRVKGDGSNF